MGPAALLVALLLAPDEPPLPEGNALVRGLVGRQRQREDALNRYTYDVEEVREQLDGRGAVKKRRTRTFEVFYAKGRPLRKLVTQDGAPLAPQARAKEEERVRKKVEAILRGDVVYEQPGLRLSQVLERYDFRTLRRETAGGRPVLVLDFAARPGKRDLDSDNVLRKLRGRVWVDEEEGQVVRAELRNTSPIRFALGIGASVSNLEFTLAFAKMEDGVWLPLRVETKAAGRKLLLRAFHVRTIVSFGRYRRFETEVWEEEARPSLW